MFQPVETHEFLLNFLAAGGVILSGTGYALGYAWARLRNRKILLAWAYGAYALLVGSVWLLVATAHLDGYWQLLAAVMLIGYFAAPRAIYRLCAETHAAGPPRHQ